MNRKKILIGISGLLALLFLYTGANKLFSLDHFREQMNNQVFPNAYVPYLIITLPVIQISIAMALMFPKTRLAGLWGSLLLMLAFTAYTVMVLSNVFGRIPCSCGGVIEELSWNEHLYFNLFLTVLAAIGILLSRAIRKGMTNTRVA